MEKINEIFKKTGTLKKILLCYFWYPSLFRSIIPVTNEDNDYILNIKLDKREDVKASKRELFFYWCYVALINVVIVLLISIVVLVINYFFKFIRCPDFIVTLLFWIIFSTSQQFGFGLMLKTPMNDEPSKKMLLIMFSYFYYFLMCILFYLILVKLGLKMYNKNLFAFLDFLVLIYWMISTAIVILNIILIFIIRSLKLWIRMNKKEKKQLIFRSVFMLIIIVLLISLVVPSFCIEYWLKFYQNNYAFNTYNLTLGYTIYITLAVGSVTSVGIFAALFDSEFWGKSLFHYISKISDNIFLLVGLIGFYTSIILMIIILPIFKFFSLVKREYITYTNINVSHILSLISLFMLFIATALLIKFFYKVVIGFKDYSGIQQKKEFLNITKWFYEVLSQDVMNLDLKLDLYAQNHLIERLAKISALTDLEIVEIFNSNSEFEKRESQNTVILAIFKYLNGECVPSFLNLQRDRLRELEYTDTSMKTELEKLQKKYGVLPPITDEIELKIEEIEKALMQTY